MRLPLRALAVLSLAAGWTAIAAAQTPPPKPPAVGGSKTTVRDSQPIPSVTRV